MTQNACNKQAASKLLKTGAGERNRTFDLLITNRDFAGFPATLQYGYLLHINYLVAAPHADVHPLTVHTGDLMVTQHETIEAQYRQSGLLGQWEQPADYLG